METTITLHGRKFQRHAVENNIHFLPMDEDEVTRLNLQHRLLQKCFDDLLVIPPVSGLSQLKDVLDLGYGSGAWAIEVAEELPECQVTGIDISRAMLPEKLPPNFKPQTGNLNERLKFAENKFDLVSSRLVGGGINHNRWPQYLREIFSTLKPGGWCQMIEFYYMAQSFSGSITQEGGLLKWSTKYLEALGDSKDLRVGRHLGAMLREAGFTNTETKQQVVEMCGWATDARKKEIGETYSQIVEATLRSISLYPLIVRLGMSKSAFEELITQACSEAMNPKVKPYFALYLAVGQKPLSE